MAAAGLAVAAGLVLVARPVAVFVSLAPFRVPWRERALASWVGLRGAAPIILATFPLVEGARDAGSIFDTVFFTVLTSVVVQGTTIPLVARRLRVAEPLATRPAWPLELSSAPPGGAELIVAPGSAAVGRSVVELGLPPGTMLLLVRRASSFSVPTGSTVLHAGDELLVLGPDVGVELLRERVQAGSGPPSSVG